MKQIKKQYNETRSRVEDAAHTVNANFMRLKLLIEKYQEEPFCAGTVHRWSQYPCRCSKDAAFMLARLLQQEGIEDLSCVMQRYGKPPSIEFPPPWHHTWVRWKNLNIDITYGELDADYKNLILIADNHPLEKCNAVPFPEWQKDNWVTGPELVALKPEPDYYLDIIFELI